MVKKAVFKADNGEQFVFGLSNGNVFYADLGEGVSVRIGTSQGFAQVGETVQTQAVGGRRIKVVGAIYNSIAEKKRDMRRVFAPFTSGKLVVDDKYYIRCYVNDAPSFTGKGNDGRFIMSLYAPYPFLQSVDESTYLIGTIIPAFRFPVNYSTPHKFGEKSSAKYSNIRNDGDVAVPYKLTISTSIKSTNVTVTDMKTLHFLKINGEILAGQSINVYRDKDGVLRAELFNGEETFDIISRIDEGSQLLEIGVGDNMILATDDEGGGSLMAQFTFNPAIAAYYEH